MAGDRERGVVIGVSDLGADVRMASGSKCESCANDCCRVDREGLVIEGADNVPGARAGDTVEVELPEGTRTRAGILTFVLPVVALVIGYILGNLVGRAVGWPADPMGAAGAIAGVSAGLLLLRRSGRDALSGARYRPVVRAIISHGLSPAPGIPGRVEDDPMSGSEGKVTT
ncbi:MAG: SoxR reducing system RseC family protein [Coriobacteriia bacterium]|nr:SoxR reducing system RseC family protein [Coriobacteriia bacterium]